MSREQRNSKRCPRVCRKKRPWLSKRPVEFGYREERDGLTVIATVRSAKPFDQAMDDQVAEALSERLGRPMTLEVVVSSVTPSGGQ